MQSIDGLSQFGYGPGVDEDVIGRLQSIRAIRLCGEYGARLFRAHRVSAHEALKLLRFVGVHDQDAVLASAISIRADVISLLSRLSQHIPSCAA